MNEIRRKPRRLHGWSLRGTTKLRLACASPRPRCSVLRVWLGDRSSCPVVGLRLCLCVPVETTPPSSRPSILPLLAAPSFVLARARSRGDGKRRWCHVSALDAKCYITRVAARSALYTYFGGRGSGLFSWLNSTFRLFVCGLTAAPSSGPVQRRRCLGSK